MPPLIEPNIHPILVHFAYALTTTGALSLFIVSLAPASGWRDTLKIAGDWMLALGALAIIATVAAGFQAYYSVDHDTPSHAAMTTHRNWAVPSAIVLLILAFWRYMKRASRPGVIYSVALLAAAGLLSVTAWWGGRLVYNYGLGVKSLPEVTGEGHDHEHAPGQGHGDESEGKDAEAHDDGHDHGAVENDGADDGHEHADGAAHDHDEADTAAAGSSSTGAAMLADGAYPETPDGVVDAFAAALRAGDEAAIRSLIAADVVIAEGGGAERSIDEYAGHHMPADMAFTAAIETTMKNRDIIADGNLATVITESQLHGSFRGENVHSRMMETMVLKRTDDRWRIAHIHWSSAPITGEHEH